jgi:hypothetical protein
VPDPLARAAWAADARREDHPLSTSSGSKWQEFFKVQQLAAPCQQLKLSYGCSVALPNDLDGKCTEVCMRMCCPTHPAVEPSLSHNSFKLITPAGQRDT